jgi:hypothetical protein
MAQQKQKQKQQQQQQQQGVVFLETFHYLDWYLYVYRSIYSRCYAIGE